MYSLRAASYIALGDELMNDPTVDASHFNNIIKDMQPSISMVGKLWLANNVVWLF